MTSNVPPSESNSDDENHYQVRRRKRSVTRRFVRREPTDKPNNANADDSLLVEMDLRAQRILIAEDNDEMRKMLASVLRRDGYEVIEAANGVELMGLIGGFLGRPTPDNAYDLVISDHRMPGFTGMEVLEELRGEHCPPPYIMITAFGSPELRHEAKSAGAVAVFSKPFDMDDLRVAVQYFIGRARL